MKELSYKDFSRQTHSKNAKLKKPNQCQFELTFRCAIKCAYCYTDCYNTPLLTRQELKTDEVIRILDKVHDTGVIWLCLTGGDPLVRPDFPKIYEHAVKKGFIITLFTSACHTPDTVLNILEKHPPFTIEMTLMGSTRETYEKISQVKGSFERAMQGIRRIREKKLPLKIKTIVVKDNIHELDDIKAFAEQIGARFNYAHNVHARLDGDTEPTSMRISPEQMIRLQEKKDLKPEGICMKPVHGDETPLHEPRINNKLYDCAVGMGDGFHVDPYGNLFLCNLIRTNKVNILEGDIQTAMNYLNPLFTEAQFETGAPCRTCELRHLCFSCPGKAHVETGDKERAIPDFCRYTLAMETFLSKKKGGGG